MYSKLMLFMLAMGNVMPALSADELEKAYWDCEFKAIQGTILPDEIPHCSGIYEYLKMKRFLETSTAYLFGGGKIKTSELALRLKSERP